MRKEEAEDKSGNQPNMANMEGPENLPRQENEQTYKGGKANTYGKDRKRKPKRHQEE